MYTVNFRSFKGGLFLCNWDCSVYAIIIELRMPGQKVLQFVHRTGVSEINLPWLLLSIEW